MRRIPLPNLPILFTVVAWAYNFTALKFVYRELSPAAVGLTRSIIVMLLFMAYCAVIKQPISYPKKLVGRLLLQGFLANGVYMVLFLEGIQRTTPAMAAIIMATAPLMTSGLAMGLKLEPFKWQPLYGMFLSLAGVAFAQSDKLHSSADGMLGNLFIFLAAALWAVSVLIMRPILEEMPAIRAVTLVLPGALVALLPYGLLATVHTVWSHLSVPGWLNYAHVAILSGGVAFVTYYKGMQQIGVVRGTAYQFLVPPLAALIAWGFLGMKPSWQLWVGLLLVLVGLYWSSALPAGKTDKLTQDA